MQQSGVHLHTHDQLLLHSHVCTVQDVWRLPCPPSMGLTEHLICEPCGFPGNPVRAHPHVRCSLCAYAAKFASAHVCAAVHAPACSLRMCGSACTQRAACTRAQPWSCMRSSLHTLHVRNHAAVACDKVVVPGAGTTHAQQLGCMRGDLPARARQCYAHVVFDRWSSPAGGAHG